jgi:hypothetical protein
MNHDLFLTHLSEKGHGTWEEFKNAWSWLSDGSDGSTEKAWIAAQRLSALGHIEIAWDETKEWAVAPPILTMIPRSGGRALLTGARTRHLCEVVRDGGNLLASGVLDEAAERLNLWVDIWVQTTGPSTIMLCCETHRDADRLASELGIEYTFSASSRLSEILPQLSSFASLWKDGSLRLGLEVERFDVDSLFWDFVDDTSQPGLYRCRTYSGTEHAINGPTGWFRVPLEAGKYEVLRWEERSVLEYSESNGSLMVRLGARLPPLHDRAAVLCSGRLPFLLKKDSYSWLVYENVDLPIAERIAASLSQELIRDHA